MYYVTVFEHQDPGMAEAGPRLKVSQATSEMSTGLHFIWRLEKGKNMLPSSFTLLAGFISLWHVTDVVGWRPLSGLEGSPQFLATWLPHRGCLLQPASQENPCSQLRQSQVAQCDHKWYSISIVIFYLLEASRRSWKGGCTKVWTPGGGAHWSLRVSLPHVQRMARTRRATRTKHTRTHSLAENL